MWSLSTLQVAWHQCAGLSAKSGVRVRGEAAKAGFGRSKARCQAAPPLHPTRIANVANLKRACFCTVFILWQDAIPARFLGQDPLHFIGAIVAGVLSVTWSTWYLVADRHRHRAAVRQVAKACLCLFLVRKLCFKTDKHRRYLQRHEKTSGSVAGRRHVKLKEDEESGMCWS